MTLPTFAAECHAAGCSLLSIDIICLHNAEKQTRRMPLLLSNDGTDRQMDVRLFRRPCCTYCVGSVNNLYWLLLLLLLFAIISLFTKCLMNEFRLDVAYFVIFLKYRFS